MDNKIVCKRVSSMLSLYIDNKVSDSEKSFIENHLNECESCYNKFLYLKSLIKSLKDSYKQIVELSLKKQQRESFNIREHEKFFANISPYIDNELDAKDCYEFRKYLIKSPVAQKELKDVYRIQRELKDCFNKTKKNVSKSISNQVIRSLKFENKKTFDFLHIYFNAQIAKIALLAIFVLFGAFEAFQYKDLIKTKVDNSVNSDIDYDSDMQKAQKLNIDYVEF